MLSKQAIQRFRQRWPAAIGAILVAGLSFWLGSFGTRFSACQFTDALFIFSALRLAPIVLAVAIAAYLLNSRLVFWIGLVGALLGPLTIYTHSTGHYLYTSQVNADQWQTIGVFGAIVGCLMTFAWQQRIKPFRFQFSIGFLIILMTIAGILVAISR